MKDTIWLSVREDTNSPIDTYAAANRIEAMYPPATGPQSKLPKFATVIGRIKVRNNATIKSNMTAKNFPITSQNLRTGSVNNNSKVPDLFSSLHCLIVRVPTKKIINIGIHRNSGLTSAKFIVKNVSTQKKIKRLAARKTPMNMTASGEPK